MGILADTPSRKHLILGGGILFTLATLAFSLSPTFAALLLASIAFSPASGAFVSLSQAVLMDLDPSHHEKNMARWTLAGSIGVLLGPFVLSGLVWLGGTWRGLFAGFSVLALLLLVINTCVSNIKAFPHVSPSTSLQLENIKVGLKGAWQALKRREVIRWLVLLEFSDMLLDIFYGYLGLYFVDVVGIYPAAVGLVVGIWTGCGFLGDILIIPLIERVSGITYLRVSSLIELVLFPAFLLAPWLAVKMVLLGLVGLCSSGWYAILMGRLYSEMPGRSGTVVTLNNLSGLLGKLIPLGIGVLAQQYGLGSAIWLLGLGPIAILAGVAGRHLAVDSTPAGRYNLENK